MPDASTIVLVLSGGNALGAYQAGGYAALHDRGVRPDWIIGGSTGAINGAIIAGNAAADRVSRLTDYWKPADDAPAVGGTIERARRTTAAAMTIAAGQPEIFIPRIPPLPWLAWGPMAEPSVYDTRPLEATLNRLVDFDRLNGDGPRYTATAVDLESGRPVAFDTSEGRVGARHIRASSALLPAFPPVEIDGRLLGDAGLTANLPVEVVLAASPRGSVLCIALDLLPLAALRPTTLGDAVSRAQDLMFASQSRLALANWQARYAADPAAPSVTLLHLSYDDQAVEVAAKAFDFSPASARHRWDAGYTDVSAALDRLADGSITTDGPGLTIWPG